MTLPVIKQECRDEKNPFSLSFGKEPVSLINRNVQSYEIIDTFEDENPAYQVCVDNCDF